MKYRKIVSATYILNIVFQAAITLVTPALFFYFIAWLFVSNLSAPSWLYVIAIVLGVITGFASMIKFVLTAMKSLEALERANEKRDAENEKTKNEK